MLMSVIFSDEAVMTGEGSDWSVTGDRVGTGSGVEYIVAPVFTLEIDSDLFTGGTGKDLFIGTGYSVLRLLGISMLQCPLLLLVRSPGLTTV